MNDIFMAKGKDEVPQMYLQRDEINKILKEHNGDTLAFDCFNSSSEFNSLYVWFVYFDSGYCDYSNKSYPSVSRAVVDLKSKNKYYEAV